MSFLPNWAIVASKTACAIKLCSAVVTRVNVMFDDRLKVKINHLLTKVNFLLILPIHPPPQSTPKGVGGTKPFGNLKIFLQKTSVQVSSPKIFKVHHFLKNIFLLPEFFNSGLQQVVNKILISMAIYYIAISRRLKATRLSFHQILEVNLT